MEILGFTFWVKKWISLISCLSVYISVNQWFVWFFRFIRYKSGG